MKVIPEGQEQETKTDELSPEELELYGNIMPSDDDEEEEAKDSSETEEPEEPEDTDTVDEESEPTDSEPQKTTGRENWGLEDYKKAYESLESKLGKQGQELGEAKQKASEPEKKNYTIDDVPDMEQSVLDEYIKAYENELSDPSIEFDDPERYKTLRREYDVLKEERAVRKAMARLNQIESKKVVATAQTDIKTKYGLTEEEATKAITLAKKLSDEGIPTKEDLEAAVYRVKPSAIEVAVTKKLTSKISEAKSKATPRVPSGSSSEAPKVISAEEFKKMDDLERERYLNECSVDEVERLLSEIN